MASVKSFYGWLGENGSLPSRGTARVIASAVLIISYISVDVSDIFNQRRGFIWFSSGDRV